VGWQGNFSELPPSPLPARALKPRVRSLTLSAVPVTPPNPKRSRKSNQPSQPPQNSAAATSGALPVANPAADEAYRILARYHPSEKGNVQFMASAWREKLRYDPIMKVWFLRSSVSGVWKEDLTDAVAHQALDAAAEARRTLALQIPEDHPDIRYREARKKNLAWSNRNEEWRTLSASVKYAQKMKLFAISPDLWDRDHFAIGTPTGIYDLRTGTLRMADSESYVSKSTNIIPSDSATCPLWTDFLDKAMRGDTEKISYLKRLAGYSLTGSVREQSLTWFVGGGGNGKGTFLDTLTSIYGDYAHPMRTEPLMMAKHDQHPTEICDLKGRRLVIASETDEGRTWRESLLKRLTGGDPITARRMHSDPITFLPSHTLIVSCNSQPALSSVGEAERRRFQILEWDVTFKFADDPTFQGGDVVRDTLFNTKLEEEHPAILRWAMEGALEWLNKGLNPPASVIAYSQAYLDDQDYTQQWLDRCVVKDKAAWTANEAIWASWETFCDARGIEHGKVTGLTQRLHRKGFASKRSGKEGDRGIAGFSLKTTDFTLNQTLGNVN
jgi:putative DNA primase/helicase